MFRRLSRVAAVVVAAVVMSAGIAWAHSYKLGPLRIGHLWAPPAAAGEGVAVYGAILDMGADPVVLDGARTEIGKDVRIRRVKDGNATFTDSFTFPPARPMAFAKWREHLFVEGNFRPLNAGDHFTMTLDFAALGEIEVDVLVEAAPSD
ncbi:copper(I)-binding protein [Breoghania corrubedonensis]|uniref:Copper(I)-binding protein n=1 Tax=Breoghania corrubedonensis TaxID=665038 RepID=A0A2T5V4S3_9HYPH|nr:copper chaperone PCu(A)C [Breoghania corrubedonensis]PTW58744.1 copper(I)-binding protein [Breoghania corrubedonensis]